MVKWHHSFQQAGCVTKSHPTKAHVCSRAQRSRGNHKKVQKSAWWSLFYWSFSRIYGLHRYIWILLNQNIWNRKMLCFSGHLKRRVILPNKSSIFPFLLHLIWVLCMHWWIKCPLTGLSLAKLCYTKSAVAFPWSLVTFGITHTH